MTKPVRLGFVGVGSMGQCAHLKNYATLASCQVVAIAEPRQQLARDVAARYGVPRTYPDAAAMLAAEELDGIVAPQQFDRHGQLIAPLYQYGLPLFTEKPLAASVAVGQELLAALERGGSWHMVGYHKRCDPAVMAARAEIDRLQQTGELGALRYVRLTMPAGDWVAGGFNDLITTDEPVPPTPPDSPEAGMDARIYHEYVVFVNFYIHQVNLMRHLLGEPFRVTHADPAGIVLLGHSESGVPVVLEMTPYSTTVDWQERALVAFEHGTVRLELPAPLASNRPGRVEFLHDPGLPARPLVSVPQLPWVHAMRQQAMQFVGAIRGENPVPCEAAEALQDLLVARDYIRLRYGLK